MIAFGITMHVYEGTPLEGSVDALVKMAIQAADEGYRDGVGEAEAHLIGARIRPDGDVDLFMCDLQPLMIPGASALLGRFVQEVVRQHDLHAVVVVTEGWSVEVRSDDPNAERIRAEVMARGTESHPNRVEVLSVEGADAFGHRGWTVPILTDGGTRRLAGTDPAEFEATEMKKHVQLWPTDRKRKGAQA